MQVVSSHPQQAASRTCRIISKKSRRVLSFSDDADTCGVVVLKDDKRQPNEYFRIITEGAHYLIQSALNGKFLSVYRGSRKEGAGLVSLERYGVDCEKFYLKPTLNGEFLIQSFCFLALDCCGEGEEAGTRVIQWGLSGRDHQKWIIEYV